MAGIDGALSAHTAATSAPIRTDWIEALRREGLEPVGFTIGGAGHGAASCWVKCNETTVVLDCAC
jgi:hypothetical protein